MVILNLIQLMNKYRNISFYSTIEGVEIPRDRGGGFSGIVG